MDIRVIGGTGAFSWGSIQVFYVADAVMNGDGQSRPGWEAVATIPPVEKDYFLTNFWCEKVFFGEKKVFYVQRFLSNALGTDEIGNRYQTFLGSRLSLDFARRSERFRWKGRGQPSCIRRFTLNFRIHLRGIRASLRC